MIPVRRRSSSISPQPLSETADPPCLASCLFLRNTLVYQCDSRCCQMPALYLEACPNMAFAYDHEAEFWGALINPDKSPSPLLEQLCLGIAQMMTTFDNLATHDLTPDRLAQFYRKVGGNYDVLFLETKPSALSFIYQRLGCFHSIQPSTDPYKPPSLPALQPHGFVRWQTIQLLLDPDEHVSYLQNAVERWDIFSPNGTLFPKTIPREAFPAEPDPEMIQWHETVSQKFEFDYWKKNLVNTSPKSSPYNNQFNAQKEASTPKSSGTYHNQFSYQEPTTPSKEEDFIQNHHPRASSYRYSVPADAQTTRRHQRRQSAEVPQTSHKSQTSLPRRSAEFVNGYASPRAPSPPTLSKHTSSKGRGRERKTYSRPVSPEHIAGHGHGHSSSDASSEDSGTATQDTFSPGYSHGHGHHRNLSPPHTPHARRHSHEAYSRRPHRDLSPDSQRRYAYREAFNPSSSSSNNRPYDSDSGRTPRQPRGYIDEVRQSRTPGPGPGPSPSYGEPIFRESATVPTSPVYGHAHPHPIHPIHPRFVNIPTGSGAGPGQAYMVHPHPTVPVQVQVQPELDANVMDDPRRSSYRGSQTPNPNPNASGGSGGGGGSYRRPRFASVGDFQPPRWSGHAGHGAGRPVPPGIIEAEYGRRPSMYER
ncbi:hypothetical protein BDW74DRAFT_69527 [Aspergillus multicolor]|uniref:uncharacterized protein n=1 Tax=Aspergillus multicolor TaxID=41759 RepID=UPI003CCD4C20